MVEKRILVPFGPNGRDLASVHHALALAERLPARVFILQWSDGHAGGEACPGWLDEALSDLVAAARQAGLLLSHMTVEGPPDEEIVGALESEAIDILVLSKDQQWLERRLLQHAPRLTYTIIRVREKEKGAAGPSPEEGGSRWRS